MEKVSSTKPCAEDLPLEFFFQVSMKYRVNEQPKLDLILFAILFIWKCCKAKFTPVLQENWQDCLPEEPFSSHVVPTSRLQVGVPGCAFLSLRATYCLSATGCWQWPWRTALNPGFQHDSQSSGANEVFLAAQEQNYWYRVSGNFWQVYVYIIEIVHKVYLCFFIRCTRLVYGHVLVYEKTEIDVAIPVLQGCSKQFWNGQATVGVVIHWGASCGCGYYCS